jgi:hypothetical protein
VAGESSGCAARREDYGLVVSPVWAPARPGHTGGTPRLGAGLRAFLEGGASGGKGGFDVGAWLAQPAKASTARDGS